MTRWRTAAACAVALTCIVNASASAQRPHVSVGGGVVAPTGYWSDHLDTGFNVLLSLGIETGALPVSLRLDGGFSQLSYSNNDHDRRLLSGTANVVFDIPAGGVTPYLIGGLGVYASSVSGTSSEFSSTDLGGNVGAGLRVPLRGFGFFLESRVHRTFSGLEDTTITFVPITVGLTLGR